MTIKAILLLVVFLTPLLEATSFFGFEQIKVLFFIVSTSLMGLFWMGKKVRWTTVNKIAGFFILSLLITSLLGIDLKSSLLGKEPYFQGWILYAYFFLFYLVVQQTKIRLEEYSWALSLSAFLVSVLSIQDWILINVFHQTISTYAGRVVSTFGQPNFYAGFILLVLPFANRLGRWKYLSLIMGSLAILASGSRAAILLLPLVFLSFMAQKVKNRLLIWGIATVFLVVIGASLFLSYSFSTGFLWQEIFNPFQSSLRAEANPVTSVEKRFFIWPLIWAVIGQRSFTGYGLENISTGLSGYFADNKHVFFEENLYPSSVLIRLKDLRIDRTHSYALDLLMFSGMFGFLAWGILICLLIRQARSRTILVALLLYLVWAEFQNQSIVHLMYFWLLAGLIAQQYKEET